LDEWIYLRRAARVWKDCVANTNFIQKVELRGCAVSIMIPNGGVSENEITYLFETAMTVTNSDQVPQWGHLRFLGFLALFRRFE